MIFPHAKLTVKNFLLVLQHILEKTHKNISGTNMKILMKLLMTKYFDNKVFPMHLTFLY